MVVKLAVQVFTSDLFIMIYVSVSTKTRVTMLVEYLGVGQGYNHIDDANEHELRLSM